VSEDERTEEQYLRILLTETWSRFDVIIEFGSSGLRKSSIIERVARGWFPFLGASLCNNRGRQQLAVSGDQSGRSDLSKRQTDGGYPSCVQRTQEGDAGEVVLGCYELCGCTKGRQCESTGALFRRDL